MRILLAAALAVALSWDAAAQERTYTKHAAAVAHPLASNAALAILRQGGSAVDAAIAAQAMLTLVEPQSSGIGGGGFLLHFDGVSGSIESYDGRETAPAGIKPDVFLNDDGSRKGFFEAVVSGQSVGVPGALRMLELAHKDHGKLPWSELFQPAIDQARAGFPISERLAGQIARDDHIPRVPSAKAYFYDGNSPKPAGTILKNPALAGTLEAVAAEGADAMHRGSIARAIVEAVQNAPFNAGTMTLEDLAAYEAKKRAPLCLAYRDHKVCGMGPPSSGGLTVLQTLGMLQAFDMSALDPKGQETAHLIAEAAKRAFADRNRYIGDTDFVEVPIQGMLAPTYLGGRAGQISRTRATEGPAEPGFPGKQTFNWGDGDGNLKDVSTTHMSIVDQWGNAVSFTSSVENVFGSRLMVKGFILNNQLTDFSFLPTRDGRPVANAVAPGKRPRSSMSPTIVTRPDGSLRLAMGSPGGSRIIGFVTRATMGVIDWNLSPQAAIDLPHVLNRNGATELEGAMTDHTAKLIEMGHETRTLTFGSGLQGIEKRPDGTLVGGADKRREGTVVGD